MKLAIVYDRVNKVGGAERLLAALHEIWPEAPLYTAVYNPETAPWAKNYKVYSSFLNHFPWAKTRHELYPWLTPLAFESFDFSDYDVVISVTSAEAKGILTGPKTLHLCYCLTPTRYLWSGARDYSLWLPLRGLISRLRVWDQVASQRPDKYFAISRIVSQRIEKYYHRSSVIIYPGVDTQKWTVSPRPVSGNYYLIVSRLVPYKKIGIAIEAFNRLKLPLKIIGQGSEFTRLESLAGPTITFLGQLTDEEVLSYYQNCQALIFPQEEDFGLVPLEAQACGRPIIAYRGGGALETVLAGKTGEFFEKQTVSDLVETLKKFDPEKYQKEDCRRQAEKFSQARFQKQFADLVSKEWKTFCKNTSIS